MIVVLLVKIKQKKDQKTKKKTIWDKNDIFLSP